MKTELSVWEYFDSKMEILPQANPTCSAVMEVQRYTQESFIWRKDNPLKWWQENLVITTLTLPKLSNAISQW